jgi:hypothetical protein
MSLLICGSRHPKNPFAAKLIVDEMIVRLPVGMVVLNGGAIGIDEYVLDAIRRLPCGHIIDFGTRWNDSVQPPSTDITALVFRPNYKLHGKRYAPVARNLHMLDLQPEMVVCLWNGESTGTRGVNEEAARRGIQTQVIVT